MAENINYRISGPRAWAMIGFAAIVDTIEIILAWFGIGIIVNILIPFVIYPFYLAWFWSYGVNFGKLDSKYADKRLYWSFGSLMAEVVIPSIPFIGDIPAFTFAVVRTIIITKAEDKENALKNSLGLTNINRTISREKERIQNRGQRKLVT